ncbi:protein of unknown function [Methylocaldum szegediense]|uniref:Uncharacterized protein n=1 Tax=Methylocaldum szegediense TaxID=73780 RepID=A0ABM9I3I8_9GAMM|nr:protein of unknown function [Methylocaldum szegediense]
MGPGRLTEDRWVKQNYCNFFLSNSFNCCGLALP